MTTIIVIVFGLILADIYLRLKNVTKTFQRLNKYLYDEVRRLEKKLEDFKEEFNMEPDALPPTDDLETE